MDINTQLESVDTSLTERPLRWNYGNNISRNIVNTGYGWKVDVDGSNTGDIYNNNVTGSSIATIFCQ